MSRVSPPNPYIDLSLTELADAISRRAGDLLDGHPTGRRDVAYLLIAAAAAIRPASSQPNSPARLVRDGAMTPLEAFADVLASEQQAVRWRVFRQAVDAAGGAVAGPAFDAVSAMATRSDADCLETLRLLEEDPGLTKGPR